MENDEEGAFVFRDSRIRYSYEKKTLKNIKDCEFEHKRMCIIKRDKIVWKRCYIKNEEKKEKNMKMSSTLDWFISNLINFSKSALSRGKILNSTLLFNEVEWHTRFWTHFERNQNNNW